MNFNIFLFCFFQAIFAQIEHQDLAKILFINQLNTWLPQCKSISATINKIDGLYVEMTISRFNQNILPSPFPSTTVFGFGCDAINPLTGQKLGFISNAPGPTLKALSGQYLSIKYTNNIQGNHLFAQNLSFMMDPYININMSAIIGVPVVVHLHGQICNSKFDGYPSSYMTAAGSQGPYYYTVEQTSNNSCIFQYPNLIKQAFLFYHDHTIGFTRLNNYAGLNGVYLIQNSQPTPLNVIDPNHDIILMIQDRTFNYDGSLNYPSSWEPEFYGDVMLVNGKAWPFMQVENGLYRLRILNACNSRIINITFLLSDNITLVPFTIVKADASYIDQSILTSYSMVFPAERYQILINFTFPLNSSIYLMNNLIPAYRGQNPFDQPLVRNIMRFDLIHAYTGKVNINTPIIYNSRVLLSDPQQIREIVIIEYLDANGDPYAGYLDGHDATVAYKSFTLGIIYQIHFINLTPDAHPIHIHLARFQVIRRLQINNTLYKIDFLNINGPLPYKTGILKYPQLQNYLTGNTSSPSQLQLASRDIIRAYPSQVTNARIRFSMPDGSDYPIDVTTGPGFALHCHILEHQDNSMMLLFKLNSNGEKVNILNIIIVILLILFTAYFIYSFESQKKFLQNKTMKKKEEKLKQKKQTTKQQNSQINMAEYVDIRQNSPS